MFCITIKIKLTSHSWRTNLCFKLQICIEIEPSPEVILSSAFTF